MINDDWHRERQEPRSKIGQITKVNEELRVPTQWRSHSKRPDVTLASLKAR